MEHLNRIVGPLYYALEAYFFSYQVSDGDFMICPKIRAALFINFFIEQEQHYLI